MVEEDVMKWVSIFIIILIGIFFVIYLLDQLTGAGIIRSLACGVLYWVPGWGNTQACQAIPV
jgi:hypothetical protein